jgi:hypothetical protein
VQEFTAKLAEENLWEGVSGKINRFLNSLTRVTEVFLTKSKKHSNKDQKTTSPSPMKPIVFDEVIERGKPERSSIREIAMEERVVTSPGKEKET